MLLRQLTVVLLAAASIVLGGCPAINPGDTSAADGNDASAYTDPNSLAGQPSSASDACLSAAESFDEMVPATYAIVVQLKSPEGADKVLDQFIGTAFAVDPWLLATNAHVVAAVAETTWPFPVKRVVAVQAGTGRVVEIDAGAKHPGYTGDPLASPDVGVLQALEQLTDRLDLASDDEAAKLALGDELALTGFPGDVEQWFDIVVGKTVPQPTALTGNVSALRNFDPDVPVTPANVDIIQHQTPTTPGTSGSPLVRCGKVVAVHNAGMMRAVVTIGQDGNLTVERQAEAANSFGISAKYLRDLISLVYAGGSDTVALPPPPPDFSGIYTGVAVDLSGAISHSFSFSVMRSGAVTGLSTWAGGLTYTLTGTADEFGHVNMVDNASALPENTLGYEGFIDVGSNSALGVYFLGDPHNRKGTWAAERK